MSYKDFLEKLEYLKRCIEAERTGTADELAQKLEVSRRTLFNYFALLQDEHCCIKFCRQRKTYYFCHMQEYDY